MEHFRKDCPEKQNSGEMQGSVKNGVSGKKGLRRELGNSKSDIRLGVSVYIKGYVEEALSCNAKLELSVQKKNLACGFLKII